MSLFSHSRERWITCRWYACWILTIAFLPLIAMYILWIYNTIRGNITSQLGMVPEITGSEENLLPNDSHEGVLTSLIGPARSPLTRDDSFCDFPLDYDELNLYNPESPILRPQSSHQQMSTVTGMP
jgi:hypothetical protein